MWVGYRSQYGQKGYNYRVDNEYGSGMFDQSNTFTTDRAGLFNMTGGVNTLGIYQSWGYYDVDYLEFRPFTPPAVQPISSHLADALANQNTQMLMNYLTGIYGQKTLAGHQHDVKQEPAISEFDVPQSVRRFEARSSQLRLHRVLADANRVRLQSAKRIRRIDRLGQAEQWHRQHELALERAGEPGEHTVRQQLRGQ